MLPVGGIGFARIGRAGGFDVTTRTIGKAGKMSGRLIRTGEGGQGAAGAVPGGCVDASST
ncbi:hypothetical protein ASG42_22970 [Rhizobium sp. Leaf391]|nr:hypothetical protein ASG42_22970 [Rhizobium sp. Leaf391]